MAPPVHSSAGAMKLGFILSLSTPLFAGSLRCATTEKISEHTYPPDFRYLPDAEVNGVMRRLAKETVAVNDSLRSEKPLSPDERRALLEHLARMEECAAELDAPGRKSNHPLIDAHASELRADLAAAKRASSLDPPNDFLAGAVTGSCVYCHSGKSRP